MQAFFCLNIIVLFTEFYTQRLAKKRPSSLTGQGGVKRGVRHRHRSDLYTTDVDKHYRRKSVNMVPKYVQANTTGNHKIEKLKKLPANSGQMFTCSPQDLQYIQRTFLKGKMPMKGEMKMLGGKMGIKFFHNGKNWVIQK